MAIATLRDLYFDELSGLVDAERQIVRALLSLAEAAYARELREVLVRHAEESRLHLERLDLIFTHWGEARRSQPSIGLTGIVQESDDRLHATTTEDVRDAAVIAAAQRIEHYVLAGYASARTFARRLNRTDEARLLQETIDDERRADRRLTTIAEAAIDRVDDVFVELSAPALPPDPVAPR